MVSAARPLLRKEPDSAPVHEGSHPRSQAISATPTLIPRSGPLHPSWPRFFSRGASVSAALLGLLALAGWALDAGVTMGPGTALTFILSGAALWLSNGEAGASKRRRAARACAVGVAMWGLLTLGESLLGWDLMPAATSLGFLMTGAALLLLDSRRGRWVLPALSLANLLMAAIALVGCLYGVEALDAIGPSAPAVPHIALGFVLLGAGTLCARPARGPIAILAGDTLGGAMARRLFPLALAPLGMGWLHLVGGRLGLYDSRFGAALLAVSTMVLFTLLLGWTAAALSRAGVEPSRAREALKQSEERLGLALKSSGVGTWSWDLVTDTIIWDDYLHPLYGLEPGTFSGRSQEFHALLHPDDLSRVSRELAGAVEGNAVYDTEYRVVWPDGTVRCLSSRGKVYRDEKGRALRMAGVCWDITDRRRTQGALARYAADLERSNLDLQEFAAVASHDLQEPLRKILAFGDRLKSQAGDAIDEQGLKYLERMQNAAERMGSLIESLLQLSRISTKGQPFEPTDLGSVVAGVLADLEVRVRESRARLEVGPLPTLCADREQLHRLFLNLIGNALKFHDPGRPLVVSVRSEPIVEGLWRVVVADNGIGFDEKYRDRIFKPFQRLHGRTAFEGSGIGLSICRKIVARHGGEITALSRPGEGSTFVLTLPDRPSPKGART